MDNQIFAADRFSAYFKKYVVEKKTTFLISAGMLFIAALAFCLGWPEAREVYSHDVVSNFVVIGNVTDPMWGPELTFFTLMWFATTLYCADFYSVLSGKKERISVFTCPASNFEKFTTYFLIYVVILPLIFFVSFLLADAIRVWVYSGSTFGVDCVHYIAPKYLLSFGCASEYWQTEYYASILAEPGAIEKIKEMFEVRAALQFSFSLFGGLLLQSLLALGSSIWTKKSGLKTICFGMIFGIVSSILFYWGMRAFFGNIAMEPRFSEGMSFFYVWDAIVLAVIIFNWVLSYARFKEWEVIKRW